MNNIRQRFTSWYHKNGYRMEYIPYNGWNGELIFRCPLWVRPLVFLFFSPCAYYREFDPFTTEECGLEETI